MIDDLFLALNLAATAINPALLPDVIAGKESHGQYLFYVAADKRHGIASKDPAMINDSALQVRFTVDVSFEEDTRRVALNEIERVQNRMAEGEKYEQFRERVEMEGPGSLLDAFDMRVVYLPIGSGENWASWVYAVQHTPQDTPSLSVWYQAVEAERTLSINAYSVSDDYTLEEILEHWQTLVDKYRDIPMQVFTGAEVD